MSSLEVFGPTDARLRGRGSDEIAQVTLNQSDATIAEDDESDDAFADDSLLDVTYNDYFA